MEASAEKPLGEKSSPADWYSRRVVSLTNNWLSNICASTIVSRTKNHLVGGAKRARTLTLELIIDYYYYLPIFGNGD